MAELPERKVEVQKGRIGYFVEGVEFGRCHFCGRTCTLSFSTLVGLEEMHELEILFGKRLRVFALSATAKWYQVTISTCDEHKKLLIYTLGMFGSSERCCL